MVERNEQDSGQHDAQDAQDAINSVDNITDGGEALLASAAHLGATDAGIVREQNAKPEMTPGELLQGARERLQLSQDAVAQHLKLSVSHVSAIENNAFASMQMPAIYLRGHMRLYANFVQLDPQYVVRCFDAINPVQACQQVRDAQSAIACDRYHAGRKRLSKRWLMIDAAVIVAVLSMAIWYMSSGDSKSALTTKSQAAAVSVKTASASTTKPSGRQVFQLNPTKASSKGE